MKYADIPRVMSSKQKLTIMKGGNISSFPRIFAKIIGVYSELLKKQFQCSNESMLNVAARSQSNISDKLEYKKMLDRCQEHHPLRRTKKLLLKA